MRVDGQVISLSDEIELEKNKKHTIEVVVDRIVIKEGIVRRLTDSVEEALKLGDGLMVGAVVGGNDYLFSTHFACPDCGISLPKPEPRISPSIIPSAPARPAWGSAPPWKRISAVSCRIISRPSVWVLSAPSPITGKAGCTSSWMPFEIL